MNHVWVLKSLAKQSGDEVGGSIGSAVKLVASILSVSFCSVMENSIYLIYHELIRKFQEVILFLLLPIFKITIVCFKF